MTQPRLWRCPKCRRWIPQRNAVHVCAPAVPVAAHFRGMSPLTRQLYNTVRAALKKIGPVETDSTKTRIAFRVRTIFLELTPLHSSLRGCLHLARRARHPSFTQALSLSPRHHYHFFKLTDPRQLNARFRRFLAEGYRVGRREHLQGAAGAGRVLPLAFARKTSRAGAAPTRPLWRCPKCGRLFVARNLWHSCARISVESHFRGKNLKLRRLFNTLVATLRRNGPLFVNANKTRITFQGRMRFAGVQVRKNGLRGGFALRRRVHDPRFIRIFSYSPRFHGHEFWLTDAKQIDRRFRSYLAEAYRVGQQEPLR